MILDKYYLMPGLGLVRLEVTREATDQCDSSPDCHDKGLASATMLSMPRGVISAIPHCGTLTAALAQLLWSCIGIVASGTSRAGELWQHLWRTHELHWP